MLKKLIFISTIFLTLFTSSYAQSFSKKASSKPVLVQEGAEKHWCPICGMKIENFYKTSHTAELNNGTKRQYCSLSCLIKDDEEYGINKDKISVVDASSEELINAKEAFYLLGSKISGTMSKTSKLAFKNKKDALEFQKKYGGEIVSFEKAFEHAKTSMKKDKKFLQNKKNKKVYPMGKKIYEKKCKEIDPSDYIEINELKANIVNENLCGKLKEKHLQALSLYLWDVKRNGNVQSENAIVVEEKERCPVCGMFVAKYPRWVAQIVYIHGDHDHKFSFDGVKDLMKFYLNPQKWGDYPVSKDKISKIKVTDYYSQNPIDGLKAFYVIGSDVYGPMGNELIPFENESDAKTFKKDHNGTKIVKFDKIEEKEVYKLDEFQK